MDTVKVGVIVGSIREKAFSRIVARYIMEVMPEWMEPEIIEIASLPLYSQDYDDRDVQPDGYEAFRDAVRSKQAVLFVTPEHNRSVPAALKNAVDIGSRPYGQSVWAKKPGAIVSVSPGSIGGFGANHHLRQSMAFLDIYMMQQPECYLGNITAALGPDGTLESEGTQAFLLGFAKSFGEWVSDFV